MRYRIAVVLLAALAGSNALWAQVNGSQRPRDLAGGKLLVASRELPDPNFSETVVFLAKYEKDGVMGLVVNRQSKFTIAKLFPEFSKDSEDPVYFGGPVNRMAVLALGRAKAKPEGTELVGPEIWMSGDRDTLDTVMKDKAASAGVRLYLGYAGWSYEQLQNEVRLGAWYIFPADAAAVFSAHPEELWRKMIRRTETQLARTLTPQR